MNPIVVIPSRMASTRLPGKPLADIHGKPMIVHVLDRALEADIGPVAVACAEPEIAEAVRAAGGRAVMTDPSLPSGSDRVHAALAVLDPNGVHDVVVNLQGDLPTIPPMQLRAVVTPLADPAFDIATLVAPIETEAEGNLPSVVKAACAFDHGRAVSAALYFSRAADPVGRRAALAPYRHLRLSPRGAGALRRAAAKARWNGARNWSNCARWRRACGSPARAWTTRPFGVDTPADLERARDANWTRTDDRHHRVPGPARRLLRPGLPHRLSRA